MQHTFNYHPLPDPEHIDLGTHVTVRFRDDAAKAAFLHRACEVSTGSPFTDRYDVHDASSPGLLTVHTFDGCEIIDGPGPTEVQVIADERFSETFDVIPS